MHGGECCPKPNGRVVSCRRRVASEADIFRAQREQRRAIGAERLAKCNERAAGDAIPDFALQEIGVADELSRIRRWPDES